VSPAAPGAGAGAPAAGGDGDRATAQILAATKRTGKTYAFNEGHDERLPVQYWFQQSAEGEVLFVVFYSQACRWSQCLGCNLPSKSSTHHVGFKALMAQVDHVFAEPEVQARSGTVRKVIISNNGSMLDEATFSSTALIYLVAMINLHLPRAAVLTVESRPEYVDLAELEILSRALKEGETPTALELAVGFEAFDDRIRNQVFRKGLNLSSLEKLAEELAPYGFRLKCYLMQKPVPGMSDEEAVEDVRRAFDYLDGLAARHGLAINVHLNPTYAAAGTPLAESFLRGEYSPPRLADVLRAVRCAQGKRLTVFVGLYDEGLAVEGGSFLRPGDEALVARLERFNQTQDFALLD
jgi:radical SAM enzyme (TIGR01210 family)